MPPAPEVDPAAPLRFVLNAASGGAHASVRGEAIEAALRVAGRRCELLLAQPKALAGVAREAAARARAGRGVLVAVGGDGTINTVAQAAHAEGCAMGVLPQGTFNYFARAHGIPADGDAAMAALLCASPRPVQVGLLNDHVFLVNASLGLYPALLQDREAWKARFGRSRWVAALAGCVTLLRQHRQLRLSIEQAGAVRNVRTPTLFVGNNALQLEQVGVNASVEAGCLAAVMLRPIGTGSLLWLLLRGAFGSLGEADDVETFGFQRLHVTRRHGGGRPVKVACDGEVMRMKPPLVFSVADQPLYLMAPPEAPGGPTP